MTYGIPPLNWYVVINLKYNNLKSKKFLIIFYTILKIFPCLQFLRSQVITSMPMSQMSHVFPYWYVINFSVYISWWLFLNFFLLTKIWKLAIINFFYYGENWASTWVFRNTYSTIVHIVNILIKNLLIFLTGKSKCYNKKPNWN